MSAPKPTVMPETNEYKTQSNNLGAPGIVMPNNADEIEEFKDVRNVDAQKLNAELADKDRDADDPRESMETLTRQGTNDPLAAARSAKYQSLLDRMGSYDEDAAKMVRERLQTEGRAR